MSAGSGHVISGTNCAPLYQRLLLKGTMTGLSVSALACGCGTSPGQNTASDHLSSSVATASNPDIELIVLDDVGYADLGAYGLEIRTPNIDSLANRDVRYNRFDTKASCWGLGSTPDWSQQPDCSHREHNFQAQGARVAIAPSPGRPAIGTEFGPRRGAR